MVSFKTGSVEIPWYAEIVGFFLVLLQCLFVVGLRMLGQQLGNPYGEDFIDIQVTTYIIMVLSTTNKILESPVNDPVDVITELNLKKRMVSLGDGWETIKGDELDDDSSLSMGVSRTEMGEACMKEPNVISKGENDASIVFSIAEENSSEFSTESEEIVGN